jgi:hypothetical protein
VTRRVTPGKGPSQLRQHATQMRRDMGSAAGRSYDYVIMGSKPCSRQSHHAARELNSSPDVSRLTVGIDMVRPFSFHIPTPDQITPHTPLRLEVAAAMFYPDGSMTASGLRCEASLIPLP